MRKVEAAQGRVLHLEAPMPVERALHLRRVFGSRVLSADYRFGRAQHRDSNTPGRRDWSHRRTAKAGGVEPDLLEPSKRPTADGRGIADGQVVAYVERRKEGNVVVDQVVQPGGELTTGEGGDRQQRPSQPGAQAGQHDVPLGRVVNAGRSPGRGGCARRGA